MKKITSLVIFAVCMVLSKSTVNAAEITVCSESCSFTTLESAITSAGNEDTIVLKESITVTSYSQITSGKIVTIDMNGFDIDSAAPILFLIKDGEITITGSGTITMTNTSADAVFFIYGSDDEEDVNYSVVNVSEGIKLIGTSYTYLVQTYLSSSASYGVVVNSSAYAEPISGVAYVNGTLQNTENPAVININEGSVVNTTGDNATGLYAAGYAYYNITGATINGLGSGIGIKAGVLTITDSIITSSDVISDPELWGNGINSSGAAIQVETNAGYAGQIEIYIENSTLKSANGYGVYEYKALTQETSYLKVLNMNNVTVTSGADIINITEAAYENVGAFIYNGTYNSEPKSIYVKTTCEVTEVDGVYTVDIITPALDTTTEQDLAGAIVTTVFVKDSETINNIILDSINADSYLANLLLESSSEVSISITADLMDEDLIDSSVIDAITSEAKDKTVASYIDINVLLNYNYNDGQTEYITSLTETIELSVKLSDDLINFEDGVTRIYYVIKLHDGETEILDATVDEDGYLNFSTNEFSVYAIAYEDVADDIENPDTGDSLISVLTLGSVSIAGMYVTLRKYKKLNSL